MVGREAASAASLVSWLVGREAAGALVSWSRVSELVSWLIFQLVGLSAGWLVSQSVGLRPVSWLKVGWSVSWSKVG